MSRRALAWVLVVASAVGAGPWARGQGAPPSPVRVAPAVLEEVAEQRLVTGQLRSLRVAEVASQEAGVVIELLIEVGQRFEAGEVLARLDDERLMLERQRTAAERAATESAIAEERAALDRWEVEVESLRAASEVGASNARERRDAEMTLAQARARLERAERDVEVYVSRLALLDRRVRDMRIVAPFAGVVTRKLTEVGEWLPEGASVCEMVATDELEVVLDVPQAYMAALAGGRLTGESFVVKLDAGGAQVAIDDVRVVPQVDERSRTFRVVARVHNDEGLLASGQSVVGWVPTGTSGAHLIVPVDAIMRSDTGSYVYVARQIGEGSPQAMPANVSVLFELPGRVVIDAGGVQAGDRVVVEGNERLYPTAPLAPTGAEGGPAPGTEGAGADEAGAAPAVEGGGR
ncbi:MAG TPA: efflux RND transporter periplasmic adaptor subunit [Phycisphaerales bacterium]|nr:efflux RND transporter periplasmic adaptor subunit [Phycisphaerales bacterium]